MVCSRSSMRYSIPDTKRPSNDGAQHAGEARQDGDETDKEAIFIGQETNPDQKEADHGH